MSDVSMGLAALALAKAWAHPAAPGDAVVEAAKRLAGRLDGDPSPEAVASIVHEELERLQLLPTHQQTAGTNLSGRG